MKRGGYDPDEIVALYLQGISHSKIGAALGIRKNQVSGVIRKALLRGRGELHKPGPIILPTERPAKRFRQLSDAPRAHPLVRQLIAEINRQQVTWDSMYQRTGVSRSVLNSWRTAYTPSLALLEACYNVLGYTLQPVRKDDVDPS